MDLNLAAREVERISSDFALALTFTGAAELRIETGCDYARPDGTVITADPQDPADGLDAKATLRGRTVAKASADEITGVLRVAFSDGSAIMVPADPDCEAWTVSWPDGALMSHSRAEA